MFLRKDREKDNRIIKCYFFYSLLFIEVVKVNIMYEIVIKLFELYFFYCILKINYDIVCREDKIFLYLYLVLYSVCIL